MRNTTNELPDGDLAQIVDKALDLLIADLSKDAKILQESRAAAQRLLEQDPALVSAGNENIRRHIQSLGKNTLNWSRIS